MKINEDLIVGETGKQLKELNKIDRNERCTMEYSYGQHDINHTTWGTTIITSNLSAQSAINNQNDITTNNGTIIISSNKYSYIKIQAYMSVGGPAFSEFKGDTALTIMKNGAATYDTYTYSNQNYWFGIVSSTIVREIKQGDYFNIAMAGAFNGTCTLLNAKVYIELFNN